MPLAALVRGNCRWGARLQTSGLNDVLFLLDGWCAGAGLPALGTVYGGVAASNEVPTMRATILCWVS